MELIKILLDLTLAICAVIALKSWKKEIKAKKKKELADKLFECIGYIEYLLIPSDEMAYPSAIYYKTLEKFGISCQENKQRLQKIWIDLKDLNQEYQQLKNIDIATKISKIEDFIQSKFKDESIDNNSLKEKIEYIKKFCIEENKKFYS
ncbi:MAG TPA: hypothetical protein PKI94_08235 [Candidatus Gastranaerophilaceae bacterium]|nr:hypothetical protein [Candidatus Gastranaerophilaceae bacterium]